MGKVELTKIEQEMLAGKHGEGVALAMKVQVATGEAFGAARMVPITRAHVALSNQDADTWFAEKMAKTGAKCKIAPTVNPGFSLEYFCGHCQSQKAMTAQDIDMMRRTHNAYKQLGAILTYNCTPYLGSNIPQFKEILGFSESSATPYVNSVWGARSNRESSLSALCAAITGLVPEYGLLLDENRKGDILVEVQADMDNDFAYQMLGYMGKKIGPGIPVFIGLKKRPTPEALMNLGAQLNTSGAYGMYHIVGVTPEAPTLEAAFGGKEPARKVVITNRDLREIRDVISHAPGRIEYALFGCPHFSINQIKQVANLVQGKKLAVDLWIMTSANNKYLAERMGIKEIINEAGGDIVEETCSDQPCWHFLKGKVGITDSPKLAYYPKKRGMEFVIRDLDTCVQAALKGEVE
jgi:Uncharacterized conserved protein